MDTGENLTWPRTNVGSTVGVILQESICGAEGELWNHVKYLSWLLIQFHLIRNPLSKNTRV